MRRMLLPSLVVVPAGVVLVAALVAVGSAQETPKPGSHRTATAKAPAPVDSPAGEAEAEGESRRDQPLVTFKGGSITVGELEDLIGGYNSLMRARYEARKEQEALLDKSLELELMAVEAQARGFGDDPDVQHATKQQAIQTMLERDFDRDESVKAVPDEEVKAYYDEHLSEFMRPEMRRASHIQVGTEEEAKKLLELVKKADVRAFRKLAREKTLDEATKLRGGDLRYFDPEGRTPGNDGQGAPLPLAKAAFSLERHGDTYDQVIKLDDGYSVLKLTGIRGKNERTLEQVTETIRLRLWRIKREQAIDELVQKLKDELKPEINAELIGLVKLETPQAIPRHDQLPPSFPAGSKPAAKQPPSED